LNIRERQFAYNYVLDADCKGNAYLSAVNAGYSKRYSIGNAYKLVVRSGIKELITTHEDNLKIKCTVTLDMKTSIAWDNYIEASKQGNLVQAEKWFDQHGRLCGDYTQKLEYKDKTDRDTFINTTILADSIQYDMKFDRKYNTV